MNFRIKAHLFLLVLLISFSSWGQILTGDGIPETPKKKNINSIDLSFFYPLSFGDNMVSDALNKKHGFQMAYHFKLFDSRLTLGPYLSFYTAKTKPGKVSSIGNYHKSTMITIGIEAGYRFWNGDNWYAIIKTGIGQSFYKNYGYNFDFTDTGGSLWVAPEAGYYLLKNFALYATLAYRHDSMSVKITPDLDSYFNSINYLYPGLGIRISY